MCTIYIPNVPGCFSCPECKKKVKCIASLRRHAAIKHPSIKISIMTDHRRLDIINRKEVKVSQNGKQFFVKRHVYLFKTFYLISILFAEINSRYNDDDLRRFKRH